MKFPAIEESVDLARDFQIVIKELIALSKTKFKNSLQKVSSITDGLNIINKITDEVIVNENKTSQNLDGDCMVIFK